MYENLKSHKEIMDTERTERVSDIEAATLRKDDLQSQIKDLGKYNISQEEKAIEKGKDDLTTSQYIDIGLY